MIVFPMAGLSSRFRIAGYDRPKYELEAHGKTLFRHCVEGFVSLIPDHSFLFITLKENNASPLIRAEMSRMGIKNFHTVELDDPTEGQAETVYLGLLELQGCISEVGSPILIFNIDTIRWGYRKPTKFELSDVDGYLEVFMGQGKNWSNVVSDDSQYQRVVHTAEKEEVSNLCCTGLNSFRSFDLYEYAYKKWVSECLRLGREKEHFIAPIYNILINEGYDIRYECIEKNDVTFCGVPIEYEEFVRSGRNDA